MPPGLLRIQRVEKLPTPVLFGTLQCPATTEPDLWNIPISHLPVPLGVSIVSPFVSVAFQSPFVHSRPDTIEGGGSEFEDNLVYKVSLWGSQGFYAEKSPSTLIEHQNIKVT